MDGREARPHHRLSHRQHPGPAQAPAAVRHFAVTVSGIDAQPLPGAANIGVRPTVSAGLQPCWKSTPAGFRSRHLRQHVDVNFLHKLRDEAKFDSLEALKAQIARDVDEVRTYFKHNDGKTHG
jgi:riboflavin kinase/FMN adenylyltransferase